MLSSGSQKIIAIGASTGGVDAVENVLSSFPARTPPIVLAIHMQAGITKLFADQLDDTLPLSVKEAETGDILVPNQVLIAPAGKHMKIVNNAGKLTVECFLGPKVQFVIPSVDVLFESIAKEAKGRAVGVLLTGIGADGARGLMAMRNSGAETIGQDEKTSIVYGMPKVAMEMGAVMHQLPLGQIAGKILSLV